MNNRDKAILDSIKKFRVLDRDQIIAMHLQDQKQKVTTANRILNRLVLKGLLKASTAKRPYEYMSVDTLIKPDSTKIPHFKAIADFYINICKGKKPTFFEVEPKVGEKGNVEADIYMAWNGATYFVEIQRSRYTNKVMQKKIDLYKKYMASDLWKDKSPKFPLIWIQTDEPYKNIDSGNLKILQAATVKECVQKYMQINKIQTSQNLTLHS